MTPSLLLSRTAEEAGPGDEMLSLPVCSEPSTTAIVFAAFPFRPGQDEFSDCHDAFRQCHALLKNESKLPIRLLDIVQVPILTTLRSTESTKKEASASKTTHFIPQRTASAQVVFLFCTHLKAASVCCEATSLSSNS